MWRCSRVYGKIQRATHGVPHFPIRLLAPPSTSSFQFYPTEHVALLSKEGIVEVDGDANVVRHGPNPLAHFRTPVGVGQVQDPVFLVEAFHGDLRAILERAVAVSGGGEQLLGEGLGSGINDSLVRYGRADDGGENGEGQVIPLGDTDGYLLAVEEDTGAGPDLRDSG